MSSDRPPKPPARADAGELHVADELAAGVEELDFAVRVVQVVGDETVADEADALQRGVALGNDLLPVLARGLRRSMAMSRPSAR